MAHNFVFIDQDWGAEAYGDCIAGLRALSGGDGLAGVVSRQPRQPAPASRFGHDGLWRASAPARSS